MPLSLSPCSTPTRSVVPILLGSVAARGHQTCCPELSGTRQPLAPPSTPPHRPVLLTAAGPSIAQKTETDCSLLFAHVRTAHFIFLLYHDGGAPRLPARHNPALRPPPPYPPPPCLPSKSGAAPSPASGPSFSLSMLFKRRVHCVECMSLRLLACCQNLMESFRCTPQVPPPPTHSAQPSTLCPAATSPTHMRSRLLLPPTTEKHKNASLLFPVSL